MSRETKTENRIDEARQLRACMNDLLSLLALPAMWSGRQPVQIIESLLDSLLGMLRLDFTYARLHDPKGGLPTEALRIAQRQNIRLPQEVGRALEDYLADGAFGSSVSVPNPVGEGKTHIARFSLGLQEESGLIVAGSQRPDFPTETEALLLRVAVNQAAIALENAQVVSQRQHAEEGLRERARLAAFNAEVGLALIQSENLPEILQHCAEAIVRHLDAAFARIWILRKEEQVLELQASAGMYTHLDGPHSRVPVGKLKIGRIAEDRRPHLTNSVIGDASVNDQEWAQQEGMVAFAGYPLIVGDTLVGVVGMFARKPLTEATLDALASVANAIALGIERKQAEVGLREQTEVVETINRLGRTLSAELELQKLVQALTDAATELTGAALGSFFYNVRDAQGESFMLYTLSGVPAQAFAHFPMPRNTDLFGPTFRGEGIIRIPDVKKDPRYGKNSPYYGMPPGHVPVTSYLAVPVTSRSGEVLGGLFFGHPEAGAFTERHERILSGLAAQAAIAIDNARLFELAQRERTETEKAREQVANILESITDSFSVYDREWRVTYLNKEAEKLLPRLGLTREETIGKNIWELFPELVGSFAYQEYHRAVAEQVPIEMEIFFPPLGGWYQMRTYPSKDGLAVYSQEITEQKQAEEALRASEKQLRLITDNIPVFIVYCDTEECYRFVNKGYAQRFGVGPEKIIGRSLRDVLGDDAYASIRQYVAGVLSGHPVEFDVEIPYADLGRRYMHCAYVPDFDSDEKVKGFYALISDITERKQNEEALRKLLEETKASREQAEEANRLKDEFLATVSHELRTPLNAMLGWTRMLRTGKLDQVTVARALETVERNAKAQAQLIEDLLDVSRIISGQMRLDVQPVNLSTIIHAAIDSVRLALDAKAIRLSVVLDPLAGSVSGDPTRLQQIIWNLLSNAIKFTPKEGRVGVQLARVNSHLEVTVSDSGIGISPEFLPHVFDRFRQADGALTRQQGGLGLGLAIVRHLVELHGAGIEAYSAGAGKGATFTVRFPLMPVRDVDLATSEESARRHPAAWPDVPFECPAALRGLRVLVVDDDSDARQLLKIVLEQCDVEVTAVASVAEALERFGELQPDVLVCDIEMPGEDGYSCIRKLRAREGKQDQRTPAAALTAHAGVADRMRALAAGFDIHVPKPVEPAELVAVIASLASRISKR